MKRHITTATKAGIAVTACVGTLSLGAALCAGEPSGASQPAKTTQVHLFIDADTVSALKSDDCWLANTFHAGDTVVFRVQIFNGATGNKMAPSQVRSVIVGGLPVTHTLAAIYSKKDGWWTAPWKTPSTLASQVVDYSVTARAVNGASGTFVGFDAVSSELTIVAAGKPAVG